MNHYICTGGCHGVSDTPGVCQAEDCAKYQQPLEECDCTDNSHYGKQIDADKQEKDS